MIQRISTRLALALGAALFGNLLAGPQPECKADKAKPNQHLEVTLAAGKASFPVRGPFEFKITLKNTGKEKIRLYKPEHDDCWRFIFDSGKMRPWHFYAQVPPGGKGRRKETKDLELEPGKETSFVFSFTPGEHYWWPATSREEDVYEAVLEKLKPGKYKVRVVFSADENIKGIWNGRITSKPVELALTESGKK